MAADGWSSAAGIQLIKSYLTEVIPQWPTGPYDCQWQAEATANILDNSNQLLIAGCGDGKTERLTSRAFDKVLRDDFFRKNLVLYCVDEAHVVVPWSKDFRADFGEINRICARIPPHVPLLLMTATLTTAAEASLVQLMGLKENQYRTIRRPIERPNIRTVFLTLTHYL
jgi:superfamily II DNA helicase RecQ